MMVIKEIEQRKSTLAHIKSVAAVWLPCRSTELVYYSVTS